MVIATLTDTAYVNAGMFKLLTDKASKVNKYNKESSTIRKTHYILNNTMPFLEKYTLL